MCIVHHQQTQEYTASRAYSLAPWIAPFSKGCKPGCLNLGSTLLNTMWLAPQDNQFLWNRLLSYLHGYWRKGSASKLKTVSPVCVSFILYSNGSSRHLQGLLLRALSAPFTSDGRHVVISALLLWVLPRVKKMKLLFPNSSLTTRQWYISINNICCSF